MMTGDPAAADPVCDKSPEHHKIEACVEKAQLPQLHQLTEKPLVFRDPKSSQKLDDEGVVF